MKQSCREFVDTIVRESTALQDSCRETVDYWDPEEPPVTILFAALGDRIAEEISSKSGEINRSMFDLIEAAMVSDDDELVAAVATGLIEAAVTKSSEQDAGCLKLLALLGAQSRKHAEAWLAE